MSPITDEPDSLTTGEPMTPTPIPACGLRRVEHWVFDLDNTLYPAHSGVFAQMNRRMTGFIATLLDLDEAGAFKVQKDYFHRYGTTMRGLMTEHGVDPHVFMDYVHDLDHSVIVPAPDLDAALAALEGRKVVFTNGSHSHAEKVLERLGIARHFEGIFDIEAGLFVPKPAPETYQSMLGRFALDARVSAMVEDSARNLVPADAIGMTTVLVRDLEHGHFDGQDDWTHCHHITDDLQQWLGGLVAARKAGA
jgi:putative hydrolase of the HAD superfamily